jgi:Ca2+-binding EF-hand superfamily protein
MPRDGERCNIESPTQSGRSGGYPTQHRIEPQASSEGSRKGRPWRTDPTSFDYPSRKDLDFTGVASKARHQDPGLSGRDSSAKVQLKQSKTKTIQEDEVSQISRLLGYRAWNKWKSLRDCFRFMDKDHSGFVSREEIRQFCRALNYEMIADRYFDLLDAGGSGRVTYPEVVGALGPHIAPGFEKPEKSKVPVADLEQERLKGDRQELLRISSLLGNAAWKRFKTVKACFNLCDRDKNGHISREEMRSVFRRFQYRDDALADRFFDLLDANNDGYVKYEEVAALLGPYIQPGPEGGTTSSADAALSKMRGPNAHPAVAKTQESRARSTPHTAQSRRGGEPETMVRTLTPRAAASKATQTSLHRSRRG